MPLQNIKFDPLQNVPIEREMHYGNSVLDDYNTFISFCTKHIYSPDINFLTKAFYFCVDKHKNIRRKSGVPYYTHPMKVAISLMTDFSIHDDVPVVAALLHDTVEDVDDVKLKDIKKEFGSNVALLVDGLTKIKGSKTRNEDTAATYGKLFRALVRDMRVIIIKLADRLDNMRTLEHLSPAKQKKIAYETLNFYTPFAQRLGLTKILKDIEDLSLYFIDQTVFESIHNTLQEKRKVFMDYIKNFFIQINNKLNERNIEHVLTFEHKHVYEIYTMIENGTPIDEIDNFYSIVISLKTQDYSQAYRVYGIVANVFGPVSSLEDFIARPRINLYRALHSIHFGPGRKLVEVKIRTEEMDEIISKGISNIDANKNSLQPLALEEADVIKWGNWMQDVIKRGDDDAITKIWGAIKKNLYAEEITVHLKNHDSVQLPAGACPIDLAFHISDQMGFHCISAKVNGNVRNLDYLLQNNDTVEIITSPNSQPSSEWEDFVITHKAIVQLHSYFKNSYSPAPSNSSKKNCINIRVTGEDRPGFVSDVKKNIGKQRINRMSFYKSATIFEILLNVTCSKKPDFMNKLFTKIWTVKGIKSIERIEE